MKSLYFLSFVVSVLFARFHFKIIRKSLYHSFYRCRHHHRGHHSAESGSDRDSSYSREERRHHRSAAVICENEPYCFSNRSIVQFRIKNYRWIQTLTAHSYKVSLDVKYNIQKFWQVSVWNLNIHNRLSNKQVFFSLKFVNILLQIEAKAVKNPSSLP